MIEFRNKTIKQIKVWAWAASVLPLTALAALFFISIFDASEIYQRALIIGAVTMFATAVTWWWWVIYTIAKVIDVLGTTIDKFEDVKEDLQEIKKELRR
jgi:Zn-dependent protease with chaperone function